MKLPFFISVILVAILVAIGASVLITTSLPVTLAGAISTVQNNGYEVLSNDQYNNLLGAIQSNTTLLNTAASNVLMFNSAVVYLFPSDTLKTVSLVASATPNTFSNWTEVKDSTGTSLTSVFATTGGYISDMYVFGIDPGTQSNSD